MTNVHMVAEAINTATDAGPDLEGAIAPVEKLTPRVHDLAAAQPELVHPIPAREVLGARIVVLQRGWVVAGMVVREGQDLVITGAKVIRRWGTSKGLGELVDGPLTGTTLDDAGTVRAHVLGVVLMIDVDAEKWGF